MTNTVYFEPYRDDASESTSSEVSRQSSTIHPERQSSLYSVIGKAISAFPFQLQTGMSRYNNKTVLSDTKGNPRFLPSESEIILEVNPNSQNLPTSDLRVFSFSELKNATKKFRSDSVLGEGGFGKVYKGWIGDKNYPKSGRGRGYVVAIKKLSLDSMQGFEEWQAEVNFLGRLSHLNVVRLLGYCWEDKELLLVYEHMQKGSFDNHLFRRHGDVQLAWNLRLKIVLGAARGLAFLHSTEKHIIYRGFKTSNILLDMNYNAKLSDFGLAKSGPINGDSHVTTRVMGTYGYAAPEYIATGHLYVKSDVYGFGVVLLEVLTGKRVLDTNRPSGQHNLIDWCKPYLFDRRKLWGMMDPKIVNQYPRQAVIQAAELTGRCLVLEPRYRPSMEEVVECLERIQVMES